MTPEEQARLEAEARQQEPAFEPLAKLMWGGDILSVASVWSGMDGTARAAWAKANPAAYARLLRYLLWLRSGLKPGAYTRTVVSRPANAPIVPPVVTPPPVPVAPAPPA